MTRRPRDLREDRGPGGAPEHGQDVRPQGPRRPRVRQPRPARRSSRGAGDVDARGRTTRSSRRPSSTATGSTSSAEASSSPRTTCGSPIRRRTPSCSTPWRRTSSSQRLRPQAPRPPHRHEPGLRPLQPAERVQRGDHQNFARFYPRRLPAEVLLDAVGSVTAIARLVSPGMPKGFRAIQLPGRVVRLLLPRRLRPAQARERLRVRAGLRGQPVAAAPPAQLVRDRVEAEQRGSGRAAGWASEKDTRTDAEKIEELYRLCLAASRPDDELEVCLSHLAKKTRIEDAAAGV